MCERQVNIRGGSTAGHAARFVAPGLLLLALAGKASAQDLEPRAFSPAPVGMNFALLGYSYSNGGVFLDQAVPVEDATGTLHNTTAVYVRTLSFLGASAKLGALVPFVWGDWEGIWMGEPATTSRRGFGDPRVSLAVNFLGAPARTLSEWRTYREDTIVGAGFLVTVPIGQYDDEKLVNLGSNRWSFRTRLGASRRTGAWTLEIMGDAWFFTENPEAFGGVSIEQEPLLAGQINVIHQFRRGFWAGAGFGYGEGGRTTVSGEQKDTRQLNRRIGGALVYPLDRRNSLKIVFIKSLATRIGSDFDRVGVFWQTRWGGGI